MKILIRKARKEDIKGMVGFFNEGIRRGFYVYNGTNKIRSAKEIREREKKFLKDRKNKVEFVAVDEDNNIVVGSCGMWAGTGRTRHRGELGWGVHPDYARKGIATKLVETIIKEAKTRGFKRIEAEAALKNVASVKLAKKFGFKIEGIRKKGLLLDNGKYVDTYLLGKVL